MNRTARKTRQRRTIRGLVPALLLALSACSGIDQGFGLMPRAGLAGRGEAVDPTTVAGIREPAGDLGHRISGEASVQFLPVIGAPEDRVVALSRALAGSAARSSVVIAPSDGPVMPRRLKGYLSAVREGNGTVLVYVWDIVDADGSRIGRIQGQERSTASARDPWVAVDDAMLARVADRTMSELRGEHATGG